MYNRHSSSTIETLLKYHRNNLTNHHTKQEVLTISLTRNDHQSNSSLLFWMRMLVFLASVSHSGTMCLQPIKADLSCAVTGTLFLCRVQDHGFHAIPGPRIIVPWGS